MRNAKLLILAWLAAATAAAQDPLQWSVKTDAAGALPGGATLTAEVTGVIQQGWHIYSLTQGPGGPFPTRILLPAGQPFTVDGKATGPQPKKEMDANFGIETESHAGTVVFRVPVKVAGGATPGESTLQIHVRYQACDETNCLPPRTDKLSVPVQLAGGGTATAAAPAPASPTPAGRGSMGSFLWLAMSMGALSLLTPCVFPMLPITVSYFAKHAAQKRGAAVRDASIYAFGIILTFTALGVALAVLFGAAGLNRFAANPWVNLGITAIFLAFAMSLLGAFELGLPSGVLTRLDSAARSRESSRVAGLLLMGLTFSLTSFTCTAPFVGTLLVMAAQGQRLDPVIGMLAFSSIFALPFFGLALAPQLVAQLPKAGGWLNSVKVVMGLLEIAAAMKFLSNVDLVWHWGIFTRTVVLAVWIAIGVLTVLYVLGYYRTQNDSAVERVGALRLTTAIAFLAITIALVPGLFDRPLGELDSFLPPAQSELSGTASLEQTGGVRWILNNLDSAKEQAGRDQKLVFVDFTGYTCTNCRWMEVNMFPRAEVKRELEKFVRVRLYTDGEGPMYERQQQMQQSQFGTVALPLYAILKADGSAVATFPGLTRDTGEFVRFLQRGEER